jgi:hypothetical protein
VEVVLYRLVYYYPVLGNSSRILSNKVISTLSGREVERLPSVRGNRTFLFTIGINRAIYSI